MHGKPLSRREFAGLAAILAAGLLLRVLWLGRADLWTDELHTLRAMELPAGEILGERMRAGHVPLYFVLLKGWTEFAGLSQTSLRLPSALLGTAALVPAWFLVRRLLDSTAAMWAAALLSIHPLYVELAREARMYPLLALAFLTAAEAAVAAAQTGRVPLRFWIAAAAGAFVHPSWAFAVVPLVVWALAERCAAEEMSEGGPDAAAARRRALGLVAAGGAASLVLLVLQLAHVEAQHQTLTRRAWPAETLVFVLRPFLGSRPSTWFPAGGLALLGWASAIWIGLRTIRAARGPSAALGASLRRLAFLLAIGVPVASLASGLIANVPWGPARYVQAASLGALLLAVAGVAATRSEPADASDGAPAIPLALRRAPLLFLAFGLFVLSAVGIGTAGTRYSTVAALVARDVPPGDVLLAPDSGTEMLLAHYTRRDVGVGVRLAAAGGTAPGDLPPCASVWLVRDPGADADLELVRLPAPR